MTILKRPIKRHSGIKKPDEHGYELGEDLSPTITPSAGDKVAVYFHTVNVWFSGIVKIEDDKIIVECCNYRLQIGVDSIDMNGITERKWVVIRMLSAPWGSPAKSLNEYLTT